MPCGNIRITKGGVTAEQKAQLIQGVTRLLVDVLGKNLQDRPVCRPGENARVCPDP